MGASIITGSSNVFNVGTNGIISVSLRSYKQYNSQTIWIVHKAGSVTIDN